MTKIKLKNLSMLLYVLSFFYADTHTSDSNRGSNNEKPYFEIFYPRNVTTVIDRSVILRCTVYNKGNKTVSWMRKKDLHILTSNNYLYTNDQRFSVLHSQGSDEWNLRIEYCQLKDAGIYECQVNTEPKISYAINLNVQSMDNLDENSSNYTDAKVRIKGPLFVKKGSTISLTCTVNIYGSAITWYHGIQVVNFDSERGGVSLEQEKTEIGTTSRLLLTKATFQDSGNYTCKAERAAPASVTVHVLNGEIPQAMQTSDAAYPSITLISKLFMIISQYYNILSNLHIKIYSIQFRGNR